jgi:hypothetical protein
MAYYRDKSPWGNNEEIVVIEDLNMVVPDGEGNQLPDFCFIDRNTVRAHPKIIDLLLDADEAERVWSMDEVLDELD